MEHALGSLAGGSVAGFELSESMMEMMGSFTLIRLIGMLGMMNVKPDKEALLALNQQLNAIKKPE